MSKVAVLVLMFSVAFAAVARDGPAAPPAGSPSDAPRDPRGVVASYGMGISFGHVELYDGEDNVIGGEVGYALNGNLGYRPWSHWAIHLSFRSFSQTDEGFIVILPSPCVVLGPAVTWYIKSQTPTPTVTVGLGYPFDALDSVDATGAIGGFVGLGYQFRRWLRVEADALLGVYDSGMTSGVTLTVNVGLP